MTEAEERQSILHRIWAAKAKALLAILEGSDPKELQASTLNVARQFLSDNGVNADSIGSRDGVPVGALDALVARMPQFLEEAESGLPKPSWNAMDERGGG